MEFINQGVWSSPVAFILSSAHQDSDVDFTVDKFEAALREVRKTGAI
jgi:glutamate-1-semialdehyde aminotransferase